MKLDTILHGDCLRVMRTLPDASVDVVFADPPYFMQLHKRLHRPDSTAVKAVDDAWDKFTDFESYDAFTAAWLQEARRLLKPAGTLWVIGSYHNIFRVGYHVQNLGFWILNDIIWHKVNPMPNFRGTRFANAHETLIWCAQSPQAKYTFNYESLKAFNDGLQMRSDWFIPVCNGPERIKDASGKKAHTTQKPEALLYRVLLTSTQAGDVVLDPFFGTGTTGAVAKRLGRHYIGIEREKTYIDYAARRLRQIEPLAPHLLTPYTKPPAPSVPFGALVARGLIAAGTRLFDKNRRFQATVTADGSLTVAGMRGSIHQAGAHCLNSTSCNGWLFWHYAAGGRLVPLDALRAKACGGTDEV